MNAKTTDPDRAARQSRHKSSKGRRDRITLAFNDRLRLASPPKFNSLLTINHVISRKVLQQDCIIRATEQIQEKMESAYLARTIRKRLVSH